jgi:hypothetical protein
LALEGAVVVTGLFLTTSGPQGIGWGEGHQVSAPQPVTFNLMVAISAFAININTHATENGVLWQASRLHVRQACKKAPTAPAPSAAGLIPFRSGVRKARFRGSFRGSRRIDHSGP